MMERQTAFEFDVVQPREATHILLSLRPEWFDKVIKGEKKFEFRKKYIRQPSTVFIYVSSPVQAICARASFGEPIVGSIEEIASIAETQRSGGGDAIRRYMKGLGQGYAIPILSYAELQRISLSDLRGRFPGFVGPQSYVLLKNKPDLLKFLLEVPEIERVR